MDALVHGVNGIRRAGVVHRGVVDDVALILATAVVVAVVAVVAVAGRLGRLSELGGEHVFDVVVSFTRQLLAHRSAGSASRGRVLGLRRLVVRHRRRQRLFFGADRVARVVQRQSPVHGLFKSERKGENQTNQNESNCFNLHQSSSAPSSAIRIPGRHLEMIPVEMIPVEMDRVVALRARLC